MKKLIISLFSVVLITGCSDSSNLYKGNNSENEDQSDEPYFVDFELESLNLTEYQTRNMGAEQPKLLYADKEKVVFEEAGIIIYNFKTEEITKTLDIWSFGDKLMELKELSELTFPSYFVDIDGENIYFTYEYIQTAFQYDIQRDVLESISIDDFFEIRDKESYGIKYLEIGNELYKKSTGSIALINETEYVYIQGTNSWLNKDIKITYVIEENEIEFKLFNSVIKDVNDNIINQAIKYSEMMTAYDGSFSNSFIVDFEIDIKEYYVITNEDFNKYEEIESILPFFFGGTGKEYGKLVEKLLPHIEMIIFNDFELNSYFIVNIKNNEELESLYSNDLYLIHNNDTSAFTLNDILEIIWNAKHSN